MSRTRRRDILSNARSGQPWMNCRGESDNRGIGRLGPGVPSSAPESGLRAPYGRLQWPSVAGRGMAWQAVVGGGRWVAQHEHGQAHAVCRLHICNALAFAAWLVNVGCRIAAVPDSAGGGGKALGAWARLWLRVQRRCRDDARPHDPVAPG
jgi:hypothetical protein